MPCLKCHSTEFYAKFNATLSAIVDDRGYIKDEIDIKKSTEAKKFGTCYICTNCKEEYVRLNPPMRHAK